MLARLSSQVGDRTAARQPYQQFADLWKNAVPGQPELSEARTALARLH